MTSSPRQARHALDVGEPRPGPPRGCRKCANAGRVRAAAWREERGRMTNDNSGRRGETGDNGMIFRPAPPKHFLGVVTLSLLALGMPDVHFPSFVLFQWTQDCCAGSQPTSPPRSPPHRFEYPHFRLYQVLSSYPRFVLRGGFSWGRSSASGCSRCNRFYCGQLATHWSNGDELGASPSICSNCGTPPLLLLRLPNARCCSCSFLLPSPPHSPIIKVAKACPSRSRHTGGGGDPSPRAV